MNHLQLSLTCSGLAHGVPHGTLRGQADLRDAAVGAAKTSMKESEE